MSEDAKYLVSQGFQISLLIWAFGLIKLLLRRAQLFAENKELNLWRNLDFDRYIILYRFIAKGGLYLSYIFGLVIITEVIFSYF